MSLDRSQSKRDADLRQRAENNQALLASIVESSDDAIVSKTLEGKILTWNAGAERLFGYSRAEAIGQSIMLIIPPERQDEERMILSRVRAGQRIEHYETVRLAKDGSRLEVSLTISPLRDNTGRLIGASKVARDITAQKRGTEALAAVRDQLASQLLDMRRLHEMSTRLSVTVELQPILDETLRTATAIEGTDMGLLSLCDPDEQFIEVGASLGFRDDFLKAVERVPPGGGSCGTCFQERRRIVIEDTEVNPLFAPFREVARGAGFRAVHSTPLITRSGRVVGVLSTHFRRPHRPSDREKHLIDLCARQAVDFIENARLYASLKEAGRRKDDFLAMLAHELRNPLAPICNSLQILRLSDDLSPTAERMREIMERQVNHLVRLVDDLLEVSRITRGKIDLHKEPVELAAIVASAVETSRPLIDAAEHQLAIALPPEPMTLNADPLRLAQVISNLLNNSAKYSEEGGQIWLSARREGEQAVVSVRDTGVGIPADMLPRIFDAFSQADRTLSRSQGGLGIGLTLAKALVQMHGGEIEGHSAGLGKGSEFIVRLPLLPPGARTHVAAKPKRARRTPIPNRRILVVDDSRDSSYVLGKLLEKLDQQVSITSDSAEALDLARRQRPDLVISDIGMPNIDGYELAQRLRQEPQTKGIVLVALTGYGQDTDRHRARQAGFDHHLVKPVSLESLEKLLGSLPEPQKSGEPPRAT